MEEESPVDQAVRWVAEAKQRAKDNEEDARALLREALAQDIAAEMKGQLKGKKVATTGATNRLYRDARRRVKEEAVRAEEAMDDEEAAVAALRREGAWMTLVRPAPAMHRRRRCSYPPAWLALLLATPREAFAYAWPPSAAQDTEVKNDRYLEKMLEKKEKEVDSLNAKQGIKKKSAIKANADLKFQLGSQYQARPPPPPLACPAYPCIAPPARGASGLRPETPGRGRKERHAAPRRAASPRPCPL